VPKVLTVELVEMKIDRAEEPKIKEIMKMPEILSPPTEATLPKAQKASIVTPKRRRMANVLDVVLEMTKALSPAPTRKVAEAANANPKLILSRQKSKLQKLRLKLKLGLQRPPRRSLSRVRKRWQDKLRLKRSRLPLPKL
jgi:hypothetical protein